MKLAKGYAAASTETTTSVFSGVYRALEYAGLDVQSLAIAMGLTLPTLLTSFSLLVRLMARLDPIEALRVPEGPH
jgi:hypothetical protein